MDKSSHIQQYFLDSQGLLHKAIYNEFLIPSIEKAADVMIAAIQAGNKIIACGNGGSMCDAMHFASELSGKYKDFRMPLPAIALSDLAAMTCIANDFGYESVFGRQIRGIGNKGDVLLAISTSGQSKNIMSAINAASATEMQTIFLKGQQESPEIVECVKIEVPSTVTNRIQEVHIKIIHILVELIEKEL